MTNSFGAASTTDEVLRGSNLTGKRVLVTGVSAGLGVETARARWRRTVRKLSALRAICPKRKPLRSRSERKRRVGVLLRSSSSIWRLSTVCAAAPTGCLPRVSLST